MEKLPLEDRISHLPHEILFHILSLLTVKEAARTSVLCKHWIDLWMSVSRLDFDAYEVFEKLSSMFDNQRDVVLKSERSKYVKWVNKVLQSQKVMTLDELKICFELDHSSQNEIDKWLYHAFSRKVQRLELDFTRDGHPLIGIRKPYAFPLGLLGVSNNGRTSDAGNGIRMHALNGFESLRSLRLSGVNVTRDILKIFLHQFHFLEHLAVHGSRDLMSVEVCGSSPALRHLEICYCFPLRSIIVCDTNLVSLKITAHTIRRNLVLKNVPMLVDVWVHGLVIRDSISLFSCFLSKLEVLTLRVSPSNIRKEAENVVEVPQLTKLKELRLIASSYEDESLIPYTSLIRASPNLERFVLKLTWYPHTARKKREFEKALNLPLPHLQVVEIYGYYGRTAEDELVKYILDNAVVLERIIIDARDQLINTKYLPKLPELEKVARSNAQELFERIRQTSSPIELVLL